jgi:hypothetical protein
MSDYDTDILAWSEEQGALLRRVAAGERLNEASLDWPNIIEEVESVGRSDLRAVQSLLLQAILHMLKAKAWPNSPSVAAWNSDARLFRVQARDAFSPSMRQRLDIARIYADALTVLPDMMDDQPPQPLPPTCPMTLDELLGV